MDTNLYFLPALCTEAMLLKHVFVLATSSMIFVKLQKNAKRAFWIKFLKCLPAGLLSLQNDCSTSVHYTKDMPTSFTKSSGRKGFLLPYI